ncbi:hypothetical protein [Streptomyces globosus]
MGGFAGVAAVLDHLRGVAAGRGVDPAATAAFMELVRAELADLAAAD